MLYTPPISLEDMHSVYKYSGIPINELLVMDIYTYRILLINAYVHESMKSEEGRKLLNDYARLSEHNTEMDIEGLISITGARSH